MTILEALLKLEFLSKSVEHTAVSFSQSNKFWISPFRLNTF